jgi:hypothetical protein
MGRVIVIEVDQSIRPPWGEKLPRVPKSCPATDVIMRKIRGRGRRFEGSPSLSESLIIRPPLGVEEFSLGVYFPFYISNLICGHQVPAGHALPKAVDLAPGETPGFQWRGGQYDCRTRKRIAKPYPSERHGGTAIFDASLTREFHAK